MCVCMCLHWLIARPERPAPFRSADVADLAAHVKRLSYDNDGLEGDGGGDLADLLVRGKVRISQSTYVVNAVVRFVRSVKAGVPYRRNQYFILPVLPDVISRCWRNCMASRT